MMAKLEPTKKEVIAPILERIRMNHGGLLKAEDVVSEAESEDNPLHPYFCWDDNEAAHQYRLWQARELITVVAIRIPNTRGMTQMYVSLSSDRSQPGGAYRGILEVLSQPELRRELVWQALEDLRFWERKYSKIAELAEIFDAIQKVRRKHRR